MITLIPTQKVRRGAARCERRPRTARDEATVRGGEEWQKLRVRQQRSPECSPALVSSHQSVSHFRIRIEVTYWRALRSAQTRFSRGDSLACFGSTPANRPKAPALACQTRAEFLFLPATLLSACAAPPLGHRRSVTAAGRHNDLSSRPRLPPPCPLIVASPMSLPPTEHEQPDGALRLEPVVAKRCDCGHADCVCDKEPLLGETLPPCQCCGDRCAALREVRVNIQEAGTFIH